MRIEPTSTPQVSSGAISAAGRAPAKATETAAPSGETGAFALSGDLAALLSKVSQLPDVRADVIESATAQLEAGTFQTPESAADAAKALLDSGDAQ